MECLTVLTLIRLKEQSYLDLHCLLRPDYPNTKNVTDT